MSFVALSAIAGGVAADLTLHRRAALGLVPSLGIWGLVALLSARAGDPPVRRWWRGSSLMIVLLRVERRSHRWWRLAVPVAGGAARRRHPAVGSSALSKDRHDPRRARARPGHGTHRSTARLAARVAIHHPGRRDVRSDLVDPARWRLVALPPTTVVPGCRRRTTARSAARSTP
ncbi:MAG: hypothetical protein R2713_06610 [Ilumatobacteraceae bacterium]